MANPVICEIKDGVARITLNRPDKLNSFTSELHAELRAEMDKVEATPGLKCVVITGAGRAFCAGQDLNERVRAPGQAPTDIGETLGRDLIPLVQRIRALPAPVIAAVNGVAAGAGASLALACDLVVAGRSAKFSFGFSRIGLIPDGAATWTLPRLVGPARAAGLALTGEAVAAEDAAAWGMIWSCVADGALSAEVDRLVEQFAKASTAALAATKAALQLSWANDLDAQLELERRVQQDRGFSADYAEGVAAFIERRPPRFESL
jgi:2-(1,2-epoxy-1,2-dihydrophenyl)acetyl-CoA isomerase